MGKRVFTESEDSYPKMAIDKNSNNLGNPYA
jgi:hypothetical protein